MAKSAIQVAPNLMVKILPHEGSEKIIGFVQSLSFGVSQGQKPIFSVDNPFPETIDQAAAPTLVTGSMSLYLPKGVTLESAGLVAPRKFTSGNTSMGQSRFFDMSVYDRLQNQLLYKIIQCKISNYSIVIQARSVVMVSVTFQAIHLEPANGIR